MPAKRAQEAKGNPAKKAKVPAKTESDVITVAHLGGAGAYSQLAAKEFFKDDRKPVVTDSCCSFKTVFERVASGDAKYGVLPMENSLSGTFRTVYNLLCEFETPMVGEITMAENACLVALEGVKKVDIKTVHSHPSMFEQCREAIAALGDGKDSVTRVCASNTSGACAELQQRKLKNSAAIASAEAAAAHGLTVLEEIHRAVAATRYIVIGKVPILNLHTAGWTPPLKTSLLLSLSNQPGALFKVMSCFAFRNLNILRTDMRPHVGAADMLKGGKQWNYDMFVDFEHVSTEGTKVASLLTNLREYCINVKTLGTYVAVHPKDQDRAPHLNLYL